MGRHLTQAEKQQVRTLVDAAGLPEMLRLIAQIARHDVQDVLRASELGTAIVKVAKQIDELNGR